MIVTITMNPSIDVSYTLENFKLDQVNRCDNVSKTAGGKGLNVSRVLKQLNEPLIATGLVGGKLGDFIKKNLEKAEITHNFSEISEETRNCIAIIHEKKQTEILESGPVINESELANFFTNLDKLLAQASILAVSGSLPKGVPFDFYNKILDLAKEKDIPVILDTSGKPLLAAINHVNKPYLIKPNVEELAAMLNIGELDNNNLETLKKSLQNDLLKDVPVVVVSLGPNGAFVKANDKFYKVDIPKIQVLNPVGSGDSTVAGLASGIFRKESLPEILKKAMALGMLNAQEITTGQVNLENYENFYHQIKVRDVK